MLIRASPLRIIPRFQVSRPYPSAYAQRPPRVAAGDAARTTALSCGRRVPSQRPPTICWPSLLIQNTSRYRRRTRQARGNRMFLRCAGQGSRQGCGRLRALLHRPVSASQLRRMNRHIRNRTYGGVGGGNAETHRKATPYPILTHRSSALGMAEDGRACPAGLPISSARAPLPQALFRYCN